MKSLPTAVISLMTFAYISGCSCDALTPSVNEIVDDPIAGQHGWPCTSNFSCKSGVCDTTQGRCVGTCTDEDNDGYGEGCALGSDCDDSDADQRTIEICGDGVDNDCDDRADESYTETCGCDASCQSEPKGATGTPFVPESKDSQGVGLDDDGALVLDATSLPPDVIWIANTGEGTISKVSTKAPFEELGRYQTGPDMPPELPGPGSASGSYPLFFGNDPSRTSVDPFTNDVYVANRAGGRVTKISELQEKCPDRWTPGNATSSGHDVLPWVDGEPTDDCIVWSIELWWDSKANTTCSRADAEGGNSSCKRPNRVRAIATQPEIGLDGVRKTIVWVGDYNLRRIWKLSENGEVLLTTTAPVRPYGFAIDGSGNLWMSTRDRDDDRYHVGRIDTHLCTNDAACETPVCVSDPSEGSEATGPCVKERIATPVPESNPNAYRLYGITVDADQRVWIGGDRRLLRYDPSAPLASRFVANDEIQPIRGISADRGFVYAARSGSNAAQIDANDPSQWISLGGTSGKNLWGVAADFDGKVWFINRGINLRDVTRDDDTSDVTLVTPNSNTLGDVTVDTDVAGYIFNAYTYSDMSGSQVRNATNPEGYYREVFEGCRGETVTPRWKSLVFDVETPAGTTVVFQVRLADEFQGLDAAPWIAVANAPADPSPVDLEAAIALAGESHRKYLEVEVVLRSSRTNEASATPRVLSFDVGRACRQTLE